MNYFLIELANVTILVCFPLLKFIHVFVTRARNQSSQQIVSNDILENPYRAPSHPTCPNGKDSTHIYTSTVLTPYPRTRQRQKHGRFLRFSRDHLNGLKYRRHLPQGPIQFPSSSSGSRLKRSEQQIFPYTLPLWSNKLDRASRFGSIRLTRWNIELDAFVPFPPQRFNGL